jgi:hypothetical protein
MELIDNELLVALIGYDSAPDYDDFSIRALRSFGRNDFSFMFIDPFDLPERRDLCAALERETGIQSIHLPYARDHRPRTWDFCTRNVPFLFKRSGRVFTWGLHRLLNEEFMDRVLDQPGRNIGFVRTYYDGDCPYPARHTGAIEYSRREIDRLSITVCDEMANFSVGWDWMREMMDPVEKDTLEYCCGDCVLNVEDFIEFNGVDEALTSYRLEDDWVIEGRYASALRNGKVSPVYWMDHMILHFGKGGRSTQAVRCRPTLADPCDLCGRMSHARGVAIEEDAMTPDLLMNHMGVFNGLRWYECQRCGAVRADTGRDFSLVKAAEDDGFWRSTIGLGERYGRNLARIRDDVLSSGSIWAATEIVNSSWHEAAYYRP